MSDDSLDCIRADVARAATVVAPQWPLSSTIAVNPLAGFEDRPFDDAISDAAALFGSRGRLTLADYRAALAAGRITIEALEAAWHHRYPDIRPDEVSRRVDQLLADDRSPEPAPRDRAVTLAEQHDHAHGSGLRAEIDSRISDWCARWSTAPDADAYWDGWRHEHRSTWPSDPAAALGAALDRLGVGPPDQRAYLERHVAALPGWAAHLRWRDDHQPDTVLGHLAACITLEADLLTRVSAPTLGASIPPAPASPSTGTEAAAVWHDAYERVVHDELLAAIAEGSEVARNPAAPLAQVVCCIDVRSEGLRRQLEAVGPYETFGYAGFFGLAARFASLGASIDGPGATDQFPVLVSSTTQLIEQPAEGAEATRRADRELARLRTAAAIDDGWRAAKYHPIAPLALAEAAGWVAAPVAAARTGAPRLTAWITDRLPAGRRSAALTEYDRTHLAIEDQAEVVLGVLRLGLVDDHRGRPRPPATLVVLCGHTSTVDNNPFESGLTCGACGGNGGGPNARAVAAMGNDPAVRACLAERDVVVPDSTWFVAVEHDTATDIVEVLDQHLVPTSFRGALDRLRSDLTTAGRAAAADRARSLPGIGSSNDQVRAVRRRGRDWAEPVAELALAGNMAFVVGPRTMTAGLDLGRRVFLHSYEASTDPDGSVLAGILTAPLVVAQWINAQYYFSTTDPEIFGAGSKAVHNVVGDVGVLSGPGGDLRRGLAIQSVRAGDTLLHEPVRLMTVVQGSCAHIDAALADSEVLQRLVAHEWIHLVARPDPAAPWMKRTAQGWQPRRLVSAPDQARP